MADAFPPDWVKDAIFYQIFPDRFAASARLTKPERLEPWDAEPTHTGYKGGDLCGIVEHLDHIEALGASALYLNPVFQAASNHRYNTYDYTKVDPMLGGDAALRELLDACHARGIRVILDGIFNHTGRGFFPFHDVLENEESSPYRDWFHIDSFPLRPYGAEGNLGYQAWWNVPSLPKLNTANPAVREYLWSVATYWLRFGVDGWRLDVPNEIDDDGFWQEFRRRCRAENPEAYLVGEIWGDASRWLRGDMFDGVMNYELTRAVLGFVAAWTLRWEVVEGSGYREIPKLGALDFAAAVRGLQEKYSPEVVAAQLNLLGSHDTPRVLTVAGGDRSAVRLALLFVMTYPGAPCLYYGDEIGLEGGRDPKNRAAMPWGRRETWDISLLDYVRRLAALRRGSRALRRGRFRELQSCGGLYVFARELDDERWLVALNTGATPARMEVSLDALPGSTGKFRDALSTLTPHSEEKLLVADISARSGAAFQEERNS